MFYDIFVNLCNGVGKSPTAVVKELGFGNSAVTNWKNGHRPYDRTMMKIADYFGVSVAYLKGEEATEAQDTATAAQEAPATGREDKIVALVNKYATLSPEKQALVLNLVDQLLQNY